MVEAFSKQNRQFTTQDFDQAAEQRNAAERKADKGPKRQGPMRGSARFAASGNTRLSADDVKFQHDEEARKWE